MSEIIFAQIPVALPARCHRAVIAAPSPFCVHRGFTSPGEQHGLLQLIRTLHRRPVGGAGMLVEHTGVIFGEGRFHIGVGPFVAEGVWPKMPAFKRVSGRVRSGARAGVVAIRAYRNGPDRVSVARIARKLGLSAVRPNWPRSVLVHAAIAKNFRTPAGTGAEIPARSIAQP